jgi:hypothetical protein
MKLVVAVMLLLLAVAMVQGEAVTRPTIPDAWNATIKGNLINFFPFTGTTPQSRFPSSNLP